MFVIKFGSCCCAPVECVEMCLLGCPVVPRRVLAFVCLSVCLFVSFSFSFYACVCVSCLNSSRLCSAFGGIVAEFVTPVAKGAGRSGEDSIEDLIYRSARPRISCPVCCISRSRAATMPDFYDAN